MAGTDLGAFNKRIHELTDEAIRESLAEISVEFEKRFGPAALTASPPVVEREAIARIACERMGDDFDAFGTHWVSTQYAEIADAILALTPVEGVGEREAAFNAGWAEAVQCIENEGPMAADHMARDTTWEAYRAALSTPVAQGDEVRDALEPFAEIARGEAFRKFADDAKSNLAICNPDGKRFALIVAEIERLDRATLTKGARDAG